MAANLVIGRSYNPIARISGAVQTVRRLPIIPMFLLGGVIFLGIFANVVAPHDPTDGNLRERLLPPVWGGPRTAEKLVVEVPESGQLLYQVTLEEAQGQDPNVQMGDLIVMETGSGTRAAGSTKFLLGTDVLGRDILSRIIFGARISLIVAAVTLGVGGGIGVAVGLLSGYYGGWMDELLMRLVDIILSLPLILVALVLVVAIGQSFEMIIVVLALWIWPRFARMVRGEVLQLKTLDYVALARVSGASTIRILFVHLFPGTINTLIVVATLQVGIVILVEATLSFLGAGVPPRTRPGDRWWPTAGTGWWTLGGWQPCPGSPS